MNSSTHHPNAPADIPPQLSDLHCFTETEGVITTTMFDAASMGMVMKSIVGGELRWFTSVLYSARNDAISRVVAETKARGGNAIICLRFESGDMGGFAQCCAYGTAAVVEKIDPATQVPPQLIN
ncbi:DUF74-domain-containing protein [Hypoxylon crocopeplum]|nr:DUF74-domain-containing protein [Hypoxylon crocopeplum]